MTAADVTQWLQIASTPVLGAICRALPAFRDRVMGNPRFLLLLALEEVLGNSAKMTAEIQGRGKDFWPVCPERYTGATFLAGTHVIHMTQGSCNDVVVKTCSFRFLLSPS